ncbi:integrin alpha-M-like [Thalassophryne amazonica]|uniref:integrin alpha-M-like n=1 Tax=Thalassophryne amazonica TaxID=390379 RepID=UPI001471D2BB|nr:integrin alpha-M-like [Thalassophryne amazonica]
MEWIVTTAVYLSVFRASLGFNIDLPAWKSLSNNAAGFGHQVVQKSSSELVVSAPLSQYEKNRRGQIFKCSLASCQAMQLQVPDFAVNMSLGLTMASDPTTKKTMVCGPTIPKDCRSITLYHGLCLQLDELSFQVPKSLEECQILADIAFLLDGSGSISSTDFRIMKTFVKNMIKPFVGKGTKFAIIQFASTSETHYYFNTFDVSRPWEALIDQIKQHGTMTNTAAGIKHVVNNIFIQSRGSRPNAKKVLIVITDGASTDRWDLENAASLANSHNIARFAIGVGDAFSSWSAKQELNIIASSPSTSHVFQVSNFNALERIRDSLQDKIFSIEGSQSSGESLKLEMAQEGFSAAFSPGGIQLGIVGANEWRGGYQKYTSRGQKFDSYEPGSIELDSYLGYSMAVAKTSKGILTIVGAPRYQHRGIVMAVSSSRQMIDPFPWQFQVGEYFGAEVCAMNLDQDDITDLILISAPMYVDGNREGKVYVCDLNYLNVQCHFDSPLVLRGDDVGTARFGSSLATMPDLDGDRLNDVVVGAPLENDGHGSIYIFNSEGRRINPTYSERITGSEVQSGLKYFGISISPLSSDMSGDNLPDLAVGSKGTVVILRSKPIVMVEAVVSFTPNQIPTQNTDCSKNLENTARICFTMTKQSEVQKVRARSNFTFTLDATRKATNSRAYISEKNREHRQSFELSLQNPQCFNIKFLTEGCPEDSLNEISNELRFTFEGIPSSDNLKPTLARQAKTTTFHPLGFEVNCRTGKACVDNLKVDFNFTSSSEVKVGIDELLDVTVFVENREENSYNSRVILTYPAGLSFRKITILQGRIECTSFDSDNGLSRGNTDCSVEKPIFKHNSKALFIVSYGIDTQSQLDKTIFVTTNATSGNVKHSKTSELYKYKEIDVKYSIFVSIESTLSYNNFTFGVNNQQKPLQHSITVSNVLRTLNITVVVKVPVQLGEKDIWVDPDSLQIPECQKQNDEPPIVTDFVAEIQKNKTVDCSVATCAVFRCNRYMGKNEDKLYMISANLSSGWTEQIGLRSAKFLLISTASLEYDRNQYIFYSPGFGNNPPVRRIEAEVEVYPVADYTKEIIGGSVGGLVLLALITAGLYKAGFFKSKYKQMISDANEAGKAATPDDGAAPAPSNAEQ